jgi:hypothetical protein
MDFTYKTKKELINAFDGLNLGTWGRSSPRLKISSCKKFFLIDRTYLNEQGYREEYTYRTDSDEWTCPSYDIVRYKDGFYIKRTRHYFNGIKKTKRVEHLGHFL